MLSLQGDQGLQYSMLWIQKTKLSLHKKQLGSYLDDHSKQINNKNNIQEKPTKDSRPSPYPTERTFLNNLYLSTP